MLIYCPIVQLLQLGPSRSVVSHKLKIDQQLQVGVQKDNIEVSSLQSCRQFWPQKCFATGDESEWERRGHNDYQLKVLEKHKDQRVPFLPLKRTNKESVEVNRQPVSKKLDGGCLQELIFVSHVPMMPGGPLPESVPPSPGSSRGGTRHPNK